ncbi:CoA transferase [Bradyrhizobium tunisiense]|uniref:CoA transferase n=1 Tax=Bradyrhizobium tunisiense TaxID=3278709 RepID=UPI0035D84E2B
MTYSLLAGIRLVEVSAFIAAPLAGLTLAQLGAQVLRIDLIGGGIDYSRMPSMPQGRSLYWTNLNKGKKSIAIDTRRPEGQELVAALATASGPGGGILLTNIPTTIPHMRLSALRPDMISCVIEGNFDGSTAVDYTVNAATGYPAMTGGGSLERPVNHVLPAWDIACALQASTSLLAAIIARRQTGLGANIRLALSDVAFATMGHLGILAEAELFGRDRPALGNDIYGAFGRDFATADGRRVMIVAISIRQWTSLVAATAMGPKIAAIEAATGLDFRREEDRFAGRDIIAALVKIWCNSLSLAEIASIFEQFNVCWSEYKTVHQLVSSDPRLSSTNPVFERIFTQGVGEHLAAGSAARVDGMKRNQTSPAPLIGADTDWALDEILGLPSQVIGNLHDRGVVAGPDQDPWKRC